MVRTVQSMPNDMVMKSGTQHPTRDGFVDFVRAASLVVVVVWHWAFTILRWGPDGPSATNPLGFTSGLWIVTWVAQVMPLFFFAGGCANMAAFAKKRTTGQSIWTFVSNRLKDLLAPAFVLIALWWLILIVVGALVELSWLKNTVILILSPLWFAFSYAIIVLLYPLFYSLHLRFSYLVPVWLAGLTALVDIARFTHKIPYVGWLNMVIVWGLAHQLGFFYEDLKKAPRRTHQAMALAGTFFLVALVWSRMYPGSMVGVPGDKFSNMAPPSLAIVALVFLQMGLMLLLRESVESRLETPAWSKFVNTIRTHAMPLYLLHTSGLAVFLIAAYFVNQRAPLSSEISWRWWAWRPLAIALPLLTTVPLLWAVQRLTRRLSAKKNRSAGLVV